ncbi:type II toxin-antitoxin system RelE/ParE family toxin [Sphingorhabdus sp.]|jgi:mRNA interferase YafQ|uniref:type II toxin-antitoxin system RelE/ParE family toxin n=1 Tax=Sphingorhabdus sp. TaxID=1902408 RepID=UPI003D81BA66
MRQIETQSRFKRDYKREKKSDPKLDEKLNPVLKMLATDHTLPARLSDHPLSGVWQGFRDCHIKPDLVLIYAKSDGMLSLARLGSHSELFG